MRLRYILALILMLTLQSCIVENDSPYIYAPCIEDIDYNYYITSYKGFPTALQVYFDVYCPQSYKYYILVHDPLRGTEFVAGTWWSRVSALREYAPLTTYIDYNYLYPNTSYLCMIGSTSGFYSEQFMIYTY